MALIVLTHDLSEQVDYRSLIKVARKELRGTVAGRWFWTWVFAFAGLASILVILALPASRVGGQAGFGRTAASLVTLVQIIVPLMGLTLGASAIAAQRESGALRFLMSHPISRTEAFWGIFAGHALALGIATTAGFGVAGLLVVMRGVTGGAAAYLWIAFGSWVLSVSMLGVGMLISTFARRSGPALGSAVFVWLLFVFVGDLGVMGTAVATGLPVGVLFFSALANPIEAFRLTALTALSGSLDALGAAGTFAIDTLGGALRPTLLAALTVWLVLPVVLASRRFVAKADL